MVTLVFLDTETTGLDPERHEVWEIGCIVRGHRNAEEYDGEWLWQLKPDLAKADPNGLRIGRYYEREQLWRHNSRGVTLASPWWNEEKRSARYPSESTHHAEVAERLAVILDGAHIVGAVPSFDAAFLAPFLRRYGQAFTAHYHLIDVEALAVGWLANQVPVEPPWDSDALSRGVGVEPDEAARHTALGDARWAMAIYDAVMGSPT